MKIIIIDIKKYIDKKRVDAIEILFEEKRMKRSGHIRANNNDWDWKS